jgi:deoxyribodipyrimidine photolyase
MPSRAVVWFRRDLRVADHPALLAALDAADQVVPTFVADGRALHALPGVYLSDFDEVRKTDGDPFRVYSPFAAPPRPPPGTTPSPPRRVCRFPTTSTPRGCGQPPAP